MICFAEFSLWWKKKLKQKVVCSLLKAEGRMGEEGHFWVMPLLLAKLMKTPLK